MNDDKTLWVFDASDGLAHILADSTTATPMILVTVCGRELLADHTATYEVAPSLAVCRVCERTGGIQPPPPIFPTPMHY